MVDRSQEIPLSALLSACLVAFTIEFDNAAEQRLAHSTTEGGRGGGPWLTSQVFWANALRYIEKDTPVSISELRARARTERQNLNGLRRWGYIKLNGDKLSSTVSLRRGGERATEVWRPLAAEIEERWRERFGSGAVDTLRAALIAVLSQIELALPDYLPLIFPAKLGRVEACAPAPPADDVEAKDLSVLLSRTLQAFTLDVEEGSKASLAMHSNTLRVIDESGVRLRDLPRLTGVSKEATAMMTTFYVAAGHAALEPDPAASRGKVLKVTEKGVSLRTSMASRQAGVEARWAEHYGIAVERVRQALENLVGTDLTREVSPLFGGLDPPEGCWRAGEPRPMMLPHFPMVLHRGGYPDGS